MPLSQPVPGATRVTPAKTANIAPIVRSKVGSAAFASDRCSDRGSTIHDREYTYPTPGITLNDWLSEPSLSPEKGELLMGKILVAIAVFTVFPLLLAQQTLNDDSVIKMAKMGFSEDMIVNAINRSPGTYDTSADGLTALKNAGVGSKVVSAMVAKQSTPALPAASAPPAAPPQIVPAANVPSATQHTVGEPNAVTASSMPAERPRVFITDSSSWEMRGAVGGSSSGFAGASSGGARPQTAEIIKTFGQRCPSVVINSRAQASDYVVELDHEGGKGLLTHKDKVAVFVQTSGDSIFSKSTLSVGGSVQDACDSILKHWAEHSSELRTGAGPLPVLASVSPSSTPLGAPIGGSHLSLGSAPDHAEIDINGAFVGNTPSVLDLPSGLQTITISKRGFKPWTRVVKLTSGTVSVFAELDPLEKTAASQ
jgi:PEGA domain